MDECEYTNRSLSRSVDGLLRDSVCPVQNDIETQYIEEDLDGDEEFDGNLHPDVVASPLDKEQQDQNIKNVVKELYGKDIKDMQTGAIRRLVYDRKDLIFVAGTGYGKSLIFQTAPLIRQDIKRTICLIIAPLKSIEKDQ